MRSGVLSALTAFVLLAVSVNGQAPEFNGEQLLRLSLNNNTCMTAASDADGAYVILQTCGSTTSQKWTLAGGTASVFGDKCLDVPSGTNTDGTKLQLWTCSVNNTNQMWYYNKWNNLLSWTENGKCADVTDGSQDNGARIQVWGCNDGDPNQIWYTSDINAQDGQFGTTTSSQSKNHQTAWIKYATVATLFYILFIP